MAQNQYFPLTVKGAIINFAHLVEASASKLSEDQDKKHYSVQLRIPKVKSDGTLNAEATRVATSINSYVDSIFLTFAGNNATVAQRMKQELIDKHGGVVIKDGDAIYEKAKKDYEAAPDFEAYKKKFRIAEKDKGYYLIQAKTSEKNGRPALVDGKRNYVSEDKIPNLFYNGATVNANITIGGYDYNGTKGATCYLNALQFVAATEPIQSSDPLAGFDVIDEQPSTGRSVEDLV